MKWQHRRTRSTGDRENTLMTKKSNTRKRTTTTVLVCSLLGVVVLVGAFFALAPFSKVPDSLDQPLAYVEQEVVNASTNHQSGSHTSVKGIKNLADVVGIESDFSRRAALYGLLNEASERELIELIEQSETVAPTSLQHTVEQAAFQRFASINPNKALAHLNNLPEHRHESLTTAIFVEWSQSHLDNAIAAAGKLGESRRAAALRGILTARDDLSEDLRRGIAKDLGNEQFAHDIISKAQVAEVSGDPQATWNVLINDEQQDMAQVVALVQTAQSWYEKEGFSALLTMQESLNDWTTRQIVLGSTVHRMSQEELKNAFDQAVAQDQGGRWSIAQIVAQAWATSDAESAFAAVSTLESGEFKHRLQETVIRNWANNDPHMVLDQLEQLPENIHGMAQEGAIIAIARTDPAEASQYLADIENGRTKSNIVWSLTSIWSNEDVHGALDWVLTDPNIANMRQQLLGEVLYRLAGVDPLLALDTALNQPVHENREGLETRVIAHLARTNIQQAIEMLSKVRDGRTKIAAYGNVGNELVHKGEINQALKLGQEFVEPDKSQYFQSIVNTWSRSNPKNLLESMDRLPSTEVQSRAAMTLIASHRWRGQLSDEQLDYARSFLSEQDARLIERGRVQVRRGNVIWPRDNGTSSSRRSPRRGS